MYFWENNPDRAFQWAELKHRAGTLREPSGVRIVLSHIEYRILITEYLF
jgi:hypothetical protein